VAGGEVERRPRVAAVRATVVAEMADVHVPVQVRRAAAHAVDRVGGVLEHRTRDLRVVEPEDETATVGELGNERVVAVDGKRSVGKARDRRTPARGDELELTVAIELVAEQIAEAERARLQALRDLGQRALVDLEQAEL